MNNVFLIGRLVKDIELRQTTIGKHVGVFSLAVSRNKNETDFIDCVAWDATAEIMSQYTHKGSKVCVMGRIQTRSYEKDGHKNKSFEIIVSNFELLDPKKEQSTPIDAYGDLPF